MEGIDIGSWNAALQVTLNVLNVLRRLTVYIAREVEVELVFLDLLDRDRVHAVGRVIGCEDWHRS